MEMIDVDRTVDDVDVDEVEMSGRKKSGNESGRM
jgi:hypothetical protein